MRPDELPPPLSGFAASLLQAERRRPAPSARQRRSLWRRACRTLIAGGLMAPAVWSGALGVAAALPKPGAVALWGALVVGVGAGAVTTVRWIEKDTKPANIAPPARYERPAAVPPPAPQVSAVDPPAGTTAVRPALQPAREQQLIDQARAALARGDVTGAELALARHGRRFAGGLFREEREALAVLVLARAGRTHDAREAGISFRRRFPDSVFLQLLSDALDGVEAGPLGR